MLIVYNKVKREAINRIINEYRWLHVIKQFSENDMNKVREILTNRIPDSVKNKIKKLKSQGYSLTQIQNALGVSHNSVNKYSK